MSREADARPPRERGAITDADVVAKIDAWVAREALSRLPSQLAMYRPRPPDATREHIPAAGTGADHRRTRRRAGGRTAGGTRRGHGCALPSSSAIRPTSGPSAPGGYRSAQDLGRGGVRPRGACAEAALGACAAHGPGEGAMSANTWRQLTRDSDLSSAPGQAAPSADGTPGGGRGRYEGDRRIRPRSEHRFWPARRIRAGSAALLSAAAIGLFLYDVVSVRADRPAMHWRRRLAEEVATRPLDDAWMIVGAAVATARPVAFLLAVTPGLCRHAAYAAARPYGPRRARPPRGRPGSAPSHAGACPVGTGRCRPPNAQSPGRGTFRDLEEVRAELDTTLGEAVTSLRLAQQPQLTVRVRRPKKG
ncbi:hypothetical protein BX257_1340 [Streptomyces sp. 3212.3]|nr:hypothetical protein BX257_1340 [Streptomyces sp. 3212.3]